MTDKKKSSNKNGDIPLLPSSSIWINVSYSLTFTHNFFFLSFHLMFNDVPLWSDYNLFVAAMSAPNPSANERHKMHHVVVETNVCLLTLSFHRICVCVCVCAFVCMWVLCICVEQTKCSAEYEQSEQVKADNVTKFVAQDCFCCDASYLLIRCA